MMALPSRIRLLFAALLRFSSLLWPVACQAPLPEWDPHLSHGGGASRADAAGEPTLQFDPPATSDAVTRIARISVTLGRALGSPRVFLFEGALGASQLRDLARPVLTQTLSARTVPALVWTSSEEDIVIAPLQALSPATLYTVGVSEPALALSFTVAGADGPPVLPRIWPDSADSALSAGAVWCAPFALPEFDREVALAPSERTGRLARGTGTMVSAPSCLGWFAGGAAPTSVAIPAVTPPAIELDGGAMVLLEPVQLWPAAPMPVPEALVCDVSEVLVGPGCASVEDDRFVLRPPERPILWTFGHEAGATVRKSRSGRSFVVRPLPADGRYRWAALDESGLNLEGEAILTPSSAMTHLVINEVLANPAGVEKDQEWVELFNDGSAAIAVGGFALETGGGTTLLPRGVIAPGAFALVVTEAFVEDDGVDPPPAPGTMLLRVPALGRDGLSNDGERLVLRDNAAQVLSAFPAMKAKSGVSNARVTPDALDVYLDSFIASSNSSATPGAPNVKP
jgi:hypothetical protein